MSNLHEIDANDEHKSLEEKCLKDPNYLEFLMEVSLRSDPFFDKMLQKLGSSAIVVLRKEESYDK